MKLNLGCGIYHKEDYVNVDFVQPCNLEYDLTNFPWPWEDDSVEEILMLDLLEHFPYNMTDRILEEARRVLKIDGRLIIQAPDFEHCALAALDMSAYLCNVCGNSGKNVDVGPLDKERYCAKCGEPVWKIAESAIKRLFGGQDREGNWHFTAFTKDILERKLKTAGFGNFEYLEKHHMWLNWNFKISATKTKDVWDE